MARQRMVPDPFARQENLSKIVFKELIGRGPISVKQFIEDHAAIFK